MDVQAIAKHDGERARADATSDMATAHRIRVSTLHDEGERTIDALSAYGL